MATLKIPEKTNSVIHYDPEADVLYISFGEPRPAEGLDIGDGTILRVDPETDEVVGLTILDFSKRAGDQLDSSIIAFEVDFGGELGISP